MGKSNFLEKMFQYKSILAGILFAGAMATAAIIPTDTTIKGNLVVTGSSTSSTFIGALSGNASTATALAANPIDCGANTYATIISANGDLTCSSITNASTTAVSTNTSSAIVLRDGSGNFSAGTITAALAGNASTSTALASNPIDCGSDTYATTIDASGNLTCASITNASTTAVSTNTPSTIILRDGSGNFSAGTVTAALTGNVTGNASTSTALASNPTDCGSNTYATTIDASGNLTCASITNASTTAVSTNTPSTIVLRDGSGNFSAGTVTATFIGNLTGNVTGNADTSTTASKWTTARNLAGNSVDGSAAVAFANKFIVQGTTDTGLSSAQFLGALGTGIVKNTTTTGVLSIAIAADFPTLNQNTSGSAATLTTPRAINGTNFDGSAAITVTAAAGTLTGTTLNSTVVSSSLTSVGTIATGVWQGTAVDATHGGTGQTTWATGDIPYASATNTISKLGAGTAGTVLTSGGALTAPTWSTVTASPAFNQLINSAFDYWQATTSITIANTVSSYGPDQWYVKNSLGTNGVITFSQTTGVTNGSKYGASVKITTAPTAAQANGTELYQVLSNLASYPLYNQTASFTILVKALGNVNQVGCQFYYTSSQAKLTTAIGSEQTATVTTGGFASCTVNGQALGTAQTTSGVVGVRVRITTVSTGNTYDLNNGFVVEQAMLNLGASASPFARKFPDPAQELIACEQFYRKSYEVDTNPGTNTAAGKVYIPGMANSSVLVGNGGISYTFSPSMYKTPTITLWAPDGTSGSVAIRKAGVAEADFAATVGNADTKRFILNGVTITGGTTGQVVEVYFHYVADGRI